MLAVVAAAHPELRLVDFIPFAGRARRVLEGLDLLSPRYPVGYPALLGLCAAAIGDVMLAGKGLAVVSGVAAVLLTGRWLGALCGLWLLVQLPLLVWGTTEGTDMVAFALAIAALSVVLPRQTLPRQTLPRRTLPRQTLPRQTQRSRLPTEGERALLAGLLAGGATMMRYPAAVVIVVVVVAATLVSARRGRAALLALVGVLLATSPHWLAALFGAGPLLPDPSENAAIGAGPGAVAALDRWWPGVQRAAVTALGAWPAQLGALGLGVGLLRRDRRALGLLAYCLLHLAMLGLFFTNPRLAMPATLAATMGVAFLLPPVALAPLAAAVLWWTWPAAQLVEPGTVPREELIAAAAALEGPVAATSPWFHIRRADGWIEGPILVKDAAAEGAHPGSLTPTALVDWARSRGIRYVAVDSGRVSRTYPGLQPLLREAVPGLREVARSSGWRLLEVEAL